MIIPDINLLLYACDSTSQFHAKAAVWWKVCMSGEEPVGLPLVVVFGFVRVGTNPRVFKQPMTPAEAAGCVRSWLARPVVHVIESGSDHVDATLKLLENIGTGGNLVTDAQIAAIALEHDAVVHTADTDFMRFAGLRWLNPITGAGSDHRRKLPAP